MLRYVDETSATVWVETDAPSLVTVTAGGAVTATTGDGAGELRGTANTFQAEGHHYALVELTGLAPGAIHEWIDSQVRGDFDHLLPASSLPFFLPDGLHFAEAWDEAVADGAWGPRAARVAKWIRSVGVMDHWASFQRSY